jgi:hypothetical protein
MTGRPAFVITVVLLLTGTGLLTGASLSNNIPLAIAAMSTYLLALIVAGARILGRREKSTSIGVDLSGSGFASDQWSRATSGTGSYRSPGEADASSPASAEDTRPPDR